jgi:DNA-binding MarR family transcriptional regulator
VSESEPTATDIEAQARLLESLLPAIMRAIFTLPSNHAVNELPIAQLRLCSLLRVGPSSMSALSREMHTSVSAVTQMADRLASAGLVERCADPEDRRARCLRLTPYGQGIMASRHNVRVQGAVRALAGLQPNDRQALLGLLETFLQASQQSPPGQPGAEITRLQT